MIPVMQQRKMQGKPETALVSENKKSLDKARACQKDTGVNLKELPVAKIGII